MKNSYIDGANLECLKIDCKQWINNFLGQRCSQLFVDSKMKPVWNEHKTFKCYGCFKQVLRLKFILDYSDFNTYLYILFLLYPNNWFVKFWTVQKCTKK